MYFILIWNKSYLAQIPHDWIMWLIDQSALSGPIPNNTKKVVERMVLLLPSHAANLATYVSDYVL